MSLDRLIPLSPDFYSLRTSFKVAGILEIGTHMALIRLASGKFLAIDAVKLTPESKRELDDLTDNGNLIEAVIGTHPHHTGAYAPFHKQYPNAKYYGTPRHLRVVPTLPWAGSSYDPAVQAKWAPEVQMRSPHNDGADPDGKLCSVFVFHKPSRIVFDDDTIAFGNNPGFLLRLLGSRHGRVGIHPSFWGKTGDGLVAGADAATRFENWLRRLLDEWDFDGMVVAHNGFIAENAKDKIVATLERLLPLASLHVKTRDAKKSPLAKLALPISIAVAVTAVALGAWLSGVF